jgi:hypothetical protein
MSEVIKAEEVISQEAFGDAWAFTMDRFGENDGELLKGYLALRAVCAVLERELDIKRMEVTLEDEE